MRKRFGPLKKITKTSLNNTPDGPGIYGIFSSNGEIQKVGRAKKNRLPERILESAKEIQDSGGQAKKFSFISIPTVEEAKKLETTLIKSRNPNFNIEEKGK